jgi:elongator complex protein 2
VQGGAPVDEEESLSEARLQFSGEQGVSYAVFLDALLVGHEDWVTSLHWMSAPSEIFGANPPAPLRLFSTSMDRNMVIWASDELAGGIWMPSVRVGDIGGALGGSVGGNLLGFVGGCMSNDGTSIVGVGYGGSFHLWSKNKKSTVNSLAVEDVEQSAQDEDERWFPVPFIGGHFGSVNDLAWWSEAGNDANTGSYLVTASSDQTCRLFAPLKTLNTVADNITNTPPLSTTASESNVVWKEVSRPQIHGYDLNCIALEPSSHVIYTGGEEKLIRVFDAPEVVLNGLKVLCGVESTVDKNKEGGVGNRLVLLVIFLICLSVCCK